MKTKLFDTFEFNTLNQQTINDMKKYQQCLNNSIASICEEIKQWRSKDIPEITSAEIKRDIKDMAKALLDRSMSNKLIEKVYFVHSDTVNKYEEVQQKLARDYTKLNSMNTSTEERNSIIARYAKDNTYFNAVKEILTSCKKTNKSLIDNTIKRFNQFENNYKAEIVKDDISLIVKTYYNSIMAYQKQKDYIGTKYDLGPYVLHSFTSELNENINHITSLCLRANRKENRPHIEYQEYKPQKAKNNPPTK